MKQELLQKISELNLNPFNEKKTAKSHNPPQYKTKEAKEIHSKVISLISKKFLFKDTESIFSFLKFTSEKEEIKKRQELFKNSKENYSEILKRLKPTKKNWNPDYEIIVVTENNKTFLELKEKNIPTQLLTSERDILDLQSYDIIQVLDTEDFKKPLEELDQTIFLKSAQNCYIERHLKELSRWEDIIKILNEKKSTEEINNIIYKLNSLLELLNQNNDKTLNPEEIEEKVSKANEEIVEKTKQMTFSGESLFSIINKGSFPQELKDIIKEKIKKYEIPEEILEKSIPLKIDEQELNKTIQKQQSNQNIKTSQKIQNRSNEIKKIPELLKKLSTNLILLDFESGINSFLKNKENLNFPEISNEMKIKKSKNIFIENAQEISFELNSNSKCSILTGANSGGKTTLLEHLIQILSLTQLGLPIQGEITIPLFSELYYFAKQKGQMSKGAFENLLSQMSEINPGQNTIILADEIEAVTEPGVAGKIISSTAKYFINKGCFLVIATHLGQEIKDFLPQKSRIDGIEATGLDENFNLIVNHNPVLGRIAHSTPELIIERMAKHHKKEYYKFLYEEIIKTN